MKLTSWLALVVFCVASARADGVALGAAHDTTIFQNSAAAAGATSNELPSLQVTFTVPGPATGALMTFAQLGMVSLRRSRQREGRRGTSAAGDGQAAEPGADADDFFARDARRNHSSLLASLASPGLAFRK